MSFSSFLLWAVNPSVGIHHEQCTFIIYDSAGRQKNNFQQLSKLIELKLFLQLDLISLLLQIKAPTSK